MFRKLSESISNLLIANEIISDEKQDAYIYGLELLIPQIIFYLGILIIAIITKTIPLSLLFMISYKVLRQYTGGFHCKSAEVCLFVSILIYLMLLLLFYFNSVLIDIVLIIASIIASVILFRFSPIEDKNKPLDNDEKRKYRKLSILFAIIAILSVVISFSLNFKTIFYAVAWSLSADAVLILLALRRCKSEESYIEGSSSNG